MLSLKKEVFDFPNTNKESGLFETQLANGIMGMSKNSVTFVKALFDDNKVRSAAILCNTMICHPLTFLDD